MYRLWYERLELNTGYNNTKFEIPYLHGVRENANVKFLSSLETHPLSLLNTNQCQN